MTPNDSLQIFSMLAALFLSAPFLGEWIGKVLEGEKHALSFLRPIESGIYKSLGVQELDPMNWKQYLSAVLGISLAGFAVLFGMQILQGTLPLNPQHFPGLSWHLAFNTAASFVSNTNWQSYSGEATMS